MSEIRIEGEPTARFKVYRVNLANKPHGEPMAAYNTASEVVDFCRKRADRRYKIEVKRAFMSLIEFNEWVDREVPR